jgi:tripartite-type tricarboxylate transporter receptor subunit TctC
MISAAIPAHLRIAVLLVVLLGPIFGCNDSAAPFPSKPITIVVPWSAGGGTDGLARALAKASSDVFGVPVNVLNKTGGQGTIGHVHGMSAWPDGYTVTMVTFELCTYRALGRGHVDVSGFLPLMQLNEDPSAITVNVDSPYTTLADFIAAAKANPGKLTVANSGPGAVWHLAAIAVEKAAGIKLTHLPFDGAAPAVVQLLGNHVDAVMVSPAEVLQHVQVGRLRTLGVMAPQRNAALPDVPTLREQDVDVVFSAWRGLALPLQTPPAIVERLSTGFKQAFDRPDFREAARKAQLNLAYMDQSTFARTLAEREASASEAVASVARSDTTPLGYLKGPGLVPAVTGGGLLILLIALGVSSLGAKPPSTDEPGRRSTPIAWAIGGLVVYWAAMYGLGYIGPTLVFMVFLQSVVMGDRRPVRIALCSVIVTALVYGAFGTILHVPLPSL